MKYIAFLFLFFLLLAAPANSAPQLGITPCTPAAQPQDLTYSASSANVHLSTCGETLIVINQSSSNAARFRIGTGSGTTAVTTDLYLGPSSFLTLNVGISGLYFAAIGSGGGTISFIQGTAGN